MNRPYLIIPTLLLTACAKAPAPVTAISFTKNYYELAVGETVQLKPVLTGEGDVLYISGNETTVQVSSSGLVTALSSGEAVVYGISNGLTAKATFRILEEASLDPVTYVRGSLDFTSALPAFSFTTTSTIPITFAVQRGQTRRIYAETPLPSGDFVNSVLALRNSPYIVANPDFNLPEGFEELCTILESCTGAVTVKSLYREGQLNSYVYDDQKYAGTAHFDLSEQTDMLQTLETALGSASFDQVSAQDFFAVLGAVLDQASIGTSQGGLKLLKTILYHSDIQAEKVEDTMTLSMTVNEAFSAEFFEYFKDYDFGENPSIFSIKSSAILAKTGDEYEIKAIEASFSASLYELSNTFTGAFQTQERRMEDETFLDKIEEGLLRDSTK